MRKILTILSILFLFTPLSAFAAINAPWSASSTDAGFVSPNAINGLFPSLLVGATSSSATNVIKLNGSSTSTIANGLNITGGGLTVGALSGFLKATAGVLQTALIDLTTNVTGILPVPNGGTGAASFTAGNRLVVSHGTSAFTDIALPLTTANGGTATTTYYSGGVVFSDGVKLTQAANSGTDALVWDAANKRFGISTTTPMSSLSVSGSINQWGNGYNHFGTQTAMDTLYCTSTSQCLVNAGTDNTLQGVQIENQNSSNGASAYVVYTLQNDRTDNTGTHYGALSLNSSGYNDNTFGTAFNQPDLMEQVNTDGAIAIEANANNVANRSYIAYYFNGASPSNEAARLTPLGLGIGTTSPHATLSANAGNTSPTKNIFELSYSTGATNNATTTVLTVATGTTALGVGTTSPWRTFSVVGTASINGLTASAGLQAGIICISANNELINESVACVASGARFKQDIATTTFSLDGLMKLNPVSFEWKKAYLGNSKDPNFTGTQYSLVADEVQKVFPQLVSVSSASSTFEGKSYPVGTVQGLADMNHWVSAIVSWLQQIVQRQDSQENEIKELKAQVKALQDAQQKPLPKQL